MPVLKVICHHDPVWEEEKGCPKYHDSSAVQDVIAYCLRSDKTVSGIVGGYGVSLRQAAYEMQLIAEVYGKDRGLRLRHMVLSFDKGETEVLRSQLYQVKRIAEYTACYYGNEYQIVYGVHEETANLHIHFVMNTVNYRTGGKYRGTKADYYAFQSYLGKFLAESYGMLLRVVPDERAL